MGPLKRDISITTWSIEGTCVIRACHRGRLAIYEVQHGDRVNVLYERCTWEAGQCSIHVDRRRTSMSSRRGRCRQPR